MGTFAISQQYQPSGSQPAAIESLLAGIDAGERYQTLLGVTGSGKTFTMANLISASGRPALVIAHNKTLAAQLCNEFREFLPEAAVEYFVSYYDYYQPEAYIAASDTYIEKDSSINDEIDRLRHSATAALLARRDVVIVASVSCIYGIGSPERYRDGVLILRTGEEHPREGIFRWLVDVQYQRNDMVLERGRFRVRGDVIEVQPADSETAYRISLFGDEVESLIHFHPLTGEVLDQPVHVAIFPATHYITPRETMERALHEIREELEIQHAKFMSEGRLVEAHRIRQRTEYDLEMMRELGFCSGIENYSRIFDGRPPGSAPYTLIDFFPDDFLCLVDESHQTMPQVRGMYEGDRSRKIALVDNGFRLPSAMDNRPLQFAEFIERVGQTVFVSATPGEFERRVSPRIVEQIVRPTGLVDPEIEVRPTQNQVDDLMNEIKARSDRNERVLITTLTKRMAEDLTEYLHDHGLKVRYLHSDIDTIERIKIVRELRLGEFDALVGVNLLREGLDLPEVTLVAILDADKEGFLRGETALIQTVGRAARHVEGRVIMYADKVSDAMAKAISETDRRRAIQVQWNTDNNVTPTSIIKGVSDIAEFLGLSGSGSGRGKRSRRDKPDGATPHTNVDTTELLRRAVELEEEMLTAAEDLRFERAAELRDDLKEVRAALESRADVAESGRRT